MNLDQRIREALRSSVRPADPTAGYQAVQARLQPALREGRSGLRIALYASLAVVIVAAITVGSLEAVKHLGGGQPILVITDDTTGVSPGPTGQISQSADSQPSAAMFRGNAARTGVYPGGGPIEEPDLLWKFKTSGGEEGSSPVVSDGIVYVAGADWNLYALDARSGVERWGFPISYGVTSSPAVSEGLVYFGTYDGFVYAVAVQNGQEQWKFQVDLPIQTNPPLTRSVDIQSSPAVADGMVYFGAPNGFLYALNAQSGEEKWRFRAYDVDDTYLPFKSSPAVAGGVVYFGTYDGYLHALDAQSGQEKWKFQAGVSGAIESSPAVSDGVVYFGAADEDAGPSRVDGGNDGYLYALDAASGELKWRSRAGDTAASPAVADGVVYFFGYEASAVSPDSPVVALDATTGRELWRFQKPSSFRGFGMGLNPSPSFSDGVVYFAAPSDVGRLRALDGRTGEELWTWPTRIAGGSPDRSSSAVSDGVVYFMGNDGYLYALK